MNDKVSVIVATYRSGGSLLYTLQSIRDQSYGNFEVIVVADGDPEDSESVVEGLGDPRFRLLRLVTNSGTQAVANQAAIDIATGKWIAYLGHDDLWMPCHLEHMLEAAARSSAQFAYALVCMLRPDGSVEVAGPPANTWKRAVDGWIVPPSGGMHLKSVSEEIGGWRRSDVWPVDFEFLQRARRHGVTFATTQKATVLTFLSHDYASYARNAANPQKAYVARLREDPRSLERAVSLARAVVAAVKSVSYDMPGMRMLWTAKQRH